MPSANARVPPGTDALARLRSAVREVAAGLRQFWKGYWLSPTSC